MTDSRRTLTVVKGGMDPASFSALPPGEKMERFMGLPAKKKLEILAADPGAEGLVRGLALQDFYLTLREMGDDGAVKLLSLGSSRQVLFSLDMELWKKWEYRPEQGFHWLSLLRGMGEERAIEQMRLLDPELIVLIFANEIAVGGGLGDLMGDEERMGEWDHSFDGIFMISFLNKKHEDTVKWTLDLLHRSEKGLYVSVMEGVKNELPTELEDLSYQFRNGRLADLGFPSPEEAMEIYAPIMPELFVPSQGKEPVVGNESLPVAVGEDDSLFQRLLGREEGEAARLELRYLLNSALIAAGDEVSDRGETERVMQRVHGRLNLALEYLSGGNEEEAAGILGREYLKTLFRLGCGILARLRKRAGQLSGGDYAVGRLIEGLHAFHPQYYLGLDPEGRDEYREFRSMEDVRKVEELLDRLTV